MLYLLADTLEKSWGPFRLLRSHALLLAAGTLLAALVVLLLLPKLWRFSPHDHGKAILGKDGMTSAGKPTGTGLWVTLLVLPILLLVLTDPVEKALCVALSQYEERVRVALRDYEPSVITRYILDVATAFNRFYHECSIFGAEDEGVKATRLALTAATKHVLGSAFGLICLRKTEKI